jgi:hypothetical protein
MLLQLHKQGFNTLQLEAYATQEFGVSGPRAKDLVHECFDLMVAGVSVLDLRRMMAGQMQRYEFVLNKAFTTKDWDLYHRTLDSMSRWFMAPIKAFVENAPPPPAATGNVADPEEDF